MAHIITDNLQEAVCWVVQVLGTVAGLGGVHDIITAQTRQWPRQWRRLISVTSIALHYL